MKATKRYYTLYISMNVEIDAFARILKSKRNQRILQVLTARDMSATEIFGELGPHAPVYRQSVHKALELMKSKGLLSKYYDDKDKCIRYKLSVEKVIIDLRNMTLSTG